MSDLPIDEQHIALVSKSIKKMTKALMQDAELLADKDEDIFLRYAAYTRLVGILKAFDMGEEIHKFMFRMGRDLGNEVFHAKEHSKRGWDEYNLNHNPFFDLDPEDCPECCEDHEEQKEETVKAFKIDSENLPEEMKDMLLGFAKMAKAIDKATGKK